MLEPIASLPAGILGFRASGRVTAEDFVTIDVALAGMQPEAPLRMLLAVTPAFRRFATTLLWEHPRCGLYRLRAGDRLALLADQDWLQQLADHASLPAGELRRFTIADEAAAVAWLSRD